MSSSSITAGGGSRGLRWLPSPLSILVVVLGVLLYAAFLSKGPWDSDYYWHLETGRLIAAGQFPRADPFSFTWSGMPWTLHEWLSELLIFRLVDGIGYVGAVLVFAAVPGVVIALLALALHRLRLRTLAIAGALIVSGLLIIPYATLRPQTLSWIMFALLVGALLHLAPPRGRWILAVLPFFVLWANLHGLWVVGLAVLVTYVLMTLAGMTPMAPARARALGMVPLAMVGTAFTPEGPGLLLYPLRYVDAGDWGAANITEWQSPNFHDPAHWPFVVFMAAVAVFGRWRVPWWLSILAFLGIAMTLFALRNGAVAAILGAPAIAVGIDSALREWRPSSGSASERVARRRRVMELAVGALVIFAGVLIFVPRDLVGRINASIHRELPVQGVEILKARAPASRVLAEYGWGGYVIGQIFRDGGRVMVDGRNDMYDDSILDEYALVRDADPGWSDVAHRYSVEALLFPPYRAITKGPAEEAGWCEAYRDENEVLYLRECE